jgi:hypothetical protein
MSLTFQNAIGNDQIVSTNGGQLAGFRNRIINGSMQVAQRGTTSCPNGAVTYGSCDRWAIENVSGSTMSVAQTIDSSYIYGSMSINTTTIPSMIGNAYITFRQRIERSNIGDLAGKQVTLSYVAAQSVTGGTLNPLVYIGYPNSPDNFATMNYTQISAPAVNIGPTKCSVTFILPIGCTTGAEILIRFQNASATVTTGVAYCNISNVQLEIGPVATPFEQRPYGLELSLCQRYYETTGGGTTSESAAFVPTRPDFAALNMRYQVTKRVVPTVTIYSQGGGVAGTVRQIDGTGSPANITATLNSTVSELVNITGTFQVGTHYGFNFTSSAEL